MRTVSDIASLVSSDIDASIIDSVATGMVVFDFELFIGARVKERKTGNFIKRQLLMDLDVLFF